jgi:transposase
MMPSAMARSIPAATARVALVALGSRSSLVALRDVLGTVFEDQRFATLFPARGQPAEAPWRLALVTPCCSSPKA